MNLLCELTSGVSILLTFILLFVAVGLIVLFYFITKHERKRFIESRLIERDKTPKNFDSLVQKAIGRITTKTNFYLLEVEISEIESMENTFGTMQVVSAFDILRKRCSSVFPMLVESCKYNADKIRILINDKITEEIMCSYLDNLLIEARKPIVLAGALRIEIDINVAVVHCPNSGKTLEELTNNLELAMVVSKRKGLNNYVLHTRELNSVESQEYKQYMEIRKAIANNEFTLYYQKIVDSNDFELYGFESLLRWNHREQGVLPPDTFLKIMEHSGDINWVGQWAFEQLCAQIYDWTKKKTRRFTLSFNLSAKQLSNPNLFGDYKKIMKNYAIDPSQIHFEIADFQVWNRSDIARINLASFKELGNIITIDDFTPESNDFAMLDILQPKIIKFSRAFLTKSMTDSATEQLLTDAINYTKERKILSIACGVEDEKAIDFVKEKSIDYAQGYLFSMPKPVEDLQL